MAGWNFDLGNDLTGSSGTGGGFNFSLGSTGLNGSPVDPNKFAGSLSALTGSSGNSSGMFDWFKDSNNLAGAGAVIGGIQGIGNLWSGFKQLGLQKDIFNTQKQFAEAEYGNQARLTNERLATRYATRQAENPERFNLALDEYMKKYGAKESVGG